MSLHQRFITVAARRRLAGRTRDCDWNWIVAFLRFHRNGEQWQHPAELKSQHVEAFLNHLALARQVSASTQNQALCALVFLYRQVELLLGHASLKTTMIYTHVMNKPSIAVTSPLNRLAVAA